MERENLTKQNRMPSPQPDVVPQRENEAEKAPAAPRGDAPMSGTGYLVVQVTTANSAIPLEGALVTVSEVREDGTDVLYELSSGKDGKTPRISLPAPPRGGSDRPSTAPPFSTYNIAVTLPGYEQSIYNQVPIFDGIVAMQQADLIPIPSNRYSDGFTVKRPNLFENIPPNL